MNDAKTVFNQDLNFDEISNLIEALNEDWKLYKTNNVQILYEIVDYDGEVLFFLQALTLDHFLEKALPVLNRENYLRGYNSAKKSVKSAFQSFTKSFE